MRALTRAAILTVGLASAAVPVTAQRIAVTPHPPDAWWGEDKVQHFAASAAVTLMAYGGARMPLEPDAAIGVAIGSAALAGLWKEVRDLRSGGPFSFRDLVWDALGITAGYFWVREIE
ncbi:MAG TPA: hypothetical protein VMN78_02920 [Longimicrobiales bacterium]|nr:hypothetical protein [Longimicrobiales bacterium]